MNVLPGEIIEIVTEDEISLVRIRMDDQVFSSIVLDTPATISYLRTGNPVRLLFKETEVIIAKTSPLAISVQNKIECVIKTIKKGKILCELALGICGSHAESAPASGQSREIRSIITRNACEQLNLRENDIIIALVKTNEVSLSAND
jgi:molybdate transport system regulatory protein